MSLKIEDKKYEVGFFGGKFFPFHKGHLFCTDVMAKECKRIIFLPKELQDWEKKHLSLKNSHNFREKFMLRIVKRVVLVITERV